MCHVFLTHLSADGHVRCFHILTITNNAAMNTQMHVYFFVISVFFFLFIPRSGISGSHRSTISSFSEKPPYWFPQWLYQVTFPPTAYWSSLCSTHLPTFVFFLVTATPTDVRWYLTVVSIFISLMISGASFHVPVGSLHFLFGKISLQVFYPFFNQVAYFKKIYIEVYELFGRRILIHLNINLVLG